MESPDSARQSSSTWSQAGFSGILGAVIGGAQLTFTLVRDDRIPLTDKLTAGAALLYLVSPIDLIADWIPVIGQLDDLALIVWAWRRLMQSAGQDVIEDIWRGDQRSLDLVLAFAGTEA